MKACLALVLASCCAVAVSPAIAGTQSGFVKDLYIRDSDGLILVDLTGTASGRPACALQPYWLIPNETTVTGKRLFAMLLAAQVSGHVVSILGKDTCHRWPDGEDIESVGVLGAVVP
jgi:hypothetical protein